MHKEALTILHHPYHLVSLLIPLFVSLVFLFLIPTMNESDTIEVVMVDQGASRLPAALQARPNILLTLVESETAVFEALDGQATAGLILPDGFDTAVIAGNAPELTIYLNSEARNSSIAKFQRYFVEETAALRDPSPLAQISWQERSPGGGTTPEFTLANFFFIVLTLLSVSVTTCSIVPHLVQDEQEQGTLQALLASPASLVDSLTGKALAVFILTMMVIVAISLMNGGFSGNWPITAVAILITAVLMIGIGLLLGLGTQKSQGKAAASAVVMIAAIPSWFAVTPIESLAPIPALILRAIPTQYFVATLNQSLSGHDWSASASNFAVLLAWTAVIYLLLGWRVQKLGNSVVGNR